MEAVLLLYEESSDSDIYLLESSSTTYSSTSESEDEINPKKAKVENYVEIVQKYTNEQFKQHFHVIRNVAEKLIDLYKIYNQKDNAHGRPEVGPELSVYLTLWYLANTESYREISDRFDVTKSTVHRILHRVINWIVTNGHNYVKWPTASEMKENQDKFYAMKRFPRVVGAIDGMHIRISRPRRNKEEYFNRERFYSILLQAIVGPDNNFMDIHCGEPGSIHDAQLFRKSPFYHHQVYKADLIITGGVLLGDSAYPEKKYLITPYKDCGTLTSKQRRFNYLHSSTRIVVENAFGLLKQRFQRLKFFESPNIGFISSCVVAACILHNICIFENDLDIVPDSENIENHNEEEIEEAIFHQNTTSIRDEIFLELDSQNLLENNSNT